MADSHIVIWPRSRSGLNGQITRLGGSAPLAQLDRASVYGDYAGVLDRSARSHLQAPTRSVYRGFLLRCRGEVTLTHHRKPAVTGHSRDISVMRQRGGGEADDATRGWLSSGTCCGRSS